VSSIEPNDCCGQMDSGEEVLGGFVVAGGDGAELLELGEEILDQVPGLVELAIVVPRSPSVLPRWNDRRFAGCCERLDDPLVGIKGLVGNERVRLDGRQQAIGPDEIMGLAARQGKANRIAERIHQRMDFGGQPTLAAPDGFVPTPFLRAPAEC
jgi:hypothetical protein